MPEPTLCRTCWHDDRAAATLARLDNDLLTAITDVAGAMHNLGKYALDVRKIEGNSP